MRAEYYWNYRCFYYPYFKSKYFAKKRIEWKKERIKKQAEWEKEHAARKAAREKAMAD